MVAVTKSDDPRAYMTEGELEVEWNGIPVEGKATIYYDPETNLNGGRIDWEDVPELGNVILGVSWISSQSYKNCVFSRVTDKAVNLISVMGPEFSVEVGYKVVDSRFKPIGEFHQIGEVRQVAPGFLKSKTQIKATYDGPKNLVSSPGYSVFLHQVGRGRIDGFYGQTIFTESGDQIHELVRRSYFYDNDRTLPFSETWNYKVLNLEVTVENGRRIWDYYATAYYTPVVSEHGTGGVFHRNLKEAKERLLVTA